MGKIGGFKEFNRADEGNIAVVERVANYNEFTIALPKDKIKNKVQDVWIVASHFAIAHVHWGI